MALQQVNLNVLSAEKRDASAKTRTQGPYGRLTDKQRAQIGKYARTGHTLTKDYTAGARLDQLKEWWTELSQVGPFYSYFLNNSKTKLLVNTEFLSRAEYVFGDTGVQICTDGGKHLGGALGNEEFVHTFLQNKVDEWREEVEMLVNIAQTQPQAAYAAFTHGVISKWNYIFYIMDFQASATTDLLQPLKAAMQLRLLPALSGQPPPNNSM